MCEGKGRHQVCCDAQNMSVGALHTVKNRVTGVNNVIDTLAHGAQYEFSQHF